MRRLAVMLLAATAWATAAASVQAQVRVGVTISTTGPAASLGVPQRNSIALMEHLVRLVTPPGGTVLDPFLGSGTTGEVALRRGRRFLGIELNPDYASMAARRIDTESGLFSTVRAIRPADLVEA